MTIENEAVDREVLQLMAFYQVDTEHQLIKAQAEHIEKLQARVAKAVTEPTQMDKRVLDPCCGSRMFWFDKSNQDTVFGDIREEEHTLCDGRVLTISPDIKFDFSDMPFDESTFNLVVFDPPHLVKLGAESWMSKKYGVLKRTWQTDISEGFSECFRVLKPNGVLIFKWNETQIKTKEILELIAKPKEK